MHLRRTVGHCLSLRQVLKPQMIMFTLGMGNRIGKRQSYSEVTGALSSSSPAPASFSTSLAFSRPLHDTNLLFASCRNFGALPPTFQPVDLAHGILRCQIPSEKQTMEELHQAYEWIPGLDSIRPTPADKKAKAKSWEEVMQKYRNGGDYILDTIFQYKLMKDPDDGKLFMPNIAGLEPSHAFAPNKYSYSVPVGTNHWIMWYTYGPPELTCEQITQDIYDSLNKMLMHENFDFVWYKNPKMTIPTVYHVQVFWHLLQDLSHQRNKQT